VPLVAILDTYLPKAATAMTFAGPAGRPELMPTTAERASAAAAGAGTGRIRRALAGLRSSVAGLRKDSGELWSYRLRLPLAGVVPFDGITQYGVFFEQGHLLTRTHRTRPWSGRALLFLAEDYPSDVSTWDAVLTGGHDIHRLPCDHPSVLREPHVETVAALLGPAVEDALAPHRATVA
jgi:thioesterase domain-containing protein